MRFLGPITFWALITVTAASAAGSPSNSPKALPSTGAAVGAPILYAPPVAGPTPAPMTAPPMMGANTQMMALTALQAFLPSLINMFSTGTSENPYSSIPDVPLDNSNFGYEEMTVAKDTMERIESINSAAKQSGNLSQEFTNVPALPGCTECSSPANSNPRFERCSAQNGYFEDFLAGINNPKVRLLKEHEPKSSLITCVAESIRENTSDTYVYCPRANRPYLGRVSRPCASENLVKTTASAFELTTECLADYVDPNLANNVDAKQEFNRSMFQLINHESRFVVNGKSHTGAGGLGQLVGGLIADVNRREFSKVQNHIRGSGNPACQKLAQEQYQPLSSARPEVAGCDRMTLEHGPQVNMMYTLAHMKMIRDQIRGTLDSLNLPEPHRRRLAAQVSVWGHNVGSGGIAQIFQLSSRRHGSLLSGSQPDINRFLQLMASDVRSWHLQNSRRQPNEPTQFLTKTHRDLARVERKANGQCGN